MANGIYLLQFLSSVPERNDGVSFELIRKPRVICISGMLPATARFQDSDVFQKAMKMTEMPFDCDFSPVRTQNLNLVPPMHICGRSFECLCFLGIHKVAFEGSKLGITKDTLANKILPFLIPVAMDNNLNLSQVSMYAIWKRE